ncbi:MAG: hypothetical protein AB1540_05180 [Bdellovibrionota bacterium]
MLHNSKQKHADHEELGAKVYAKFINYRSGEILLFAPAMGNLEIPAFDGIIFDITKMAIANFSLKTIYSKMPLEAAVRAINATKAYSEKRNWLRAHGFIQPANGPVMEGWNKDMLRSRQFDELFGWVQEATHLFGISSLEYRPARIVLHFAESKFHPEEGLVLALQSLIREAGKTGDSVTLLDDAKALVVSGHEAQLFNLE